MFNQNANALVQQGIKYLRANQLLPAESQFESALKLAPKHPDALHLLGIIRVTTTRGMAVGIIYHTDFIKFI